MTHVGKAKSPRALGGGSQKLEAPASPKIPREGLKVHDSASVMVLAGRHGDRHISENPLSSLMGCMGRDLRYAFFVGNPILS